MTDGEDRDLAALDLYIRSQLDIAAGTYAAQADLDGRLAAAFHAGGQQDFNEPTAES